MEHYSKTQTIDFTTAEKCNFTLFPIPASNPFRLQPIITYRSKSNYCKKSYDEKTSHFDILCCVYIETKGSSQKVELSQQG